MRLPIPSSVIILNCTVVLRYRCKIEKPGDTRKFSGGLDFNSVIRRPKAPENIVEFWKNRAILPLIHGL